MGGRRTWTIRDVLDWTCGYLGRRGDEHARLSAEMLLSAALGLSRVEVYLNFDRPLTADELAVLHDAVERRGRGEPVQYVVGETAFRHIVVRCAPGVLIPRPETEVLVDQALAELDARRGEGEGPARVLEVVRRGSSSDKSFARTRAKLGVISDGCGGAAEGLGLSE